MNRNFTVLRININGDVVKTVMVCLTRDEAVGLATAANTGLLVNEPDCYFVAEER